MKTLTVGLIGYDFMGRAHSNAYRQVGHFYDLPAKVRMKTVCGRTESAVKEAADRLGWEGYATNWQSVIDDPEIDLIDISTPGATHAEIAVAASQAGKHVLCEKPLATTLQEAEAMAEAAKASGRAHGVMFNYRKVPAIAHAKRLIEEGAIGRVRQFRAAYLQDWLADCDAEMSWRLDASKAGSGAHGDLGSHLTDLARFLVGEISAVCGMQTTFVQERPLPDGGKGKVTVDDASAFLARFADGATGVFEMSRVAHGRKNHNRFEINGEKGSIKFDLERLNELQIALPEEDGCVEGFRTIHVTGDRYEGSAAWWPPGHGLGYEHTFIIYLAEAIQAICSGSEISPSFSDGLAAQRVLDAAAQTGESGAWVTLG